jgi:RimJ/RimL family protein N-acetyltransferase
MPVRRSLEEKRAGCAGHIMPQGHPGGQAAAGRGFSPRLRGAGGRRTPRPETSRPGSSGLLHWVVMRTLETDRLALRPIAEGDAAFIRELLNEPSFIKFIGDRHVRTLDDARAYIRNGPMASYRRYGLGLMLVALKDTGTAIGICGLLKRDTLEDIDVGFAFLPAYWSKGYAFESAAAVMADGRARFGLTRIVAITNPDNTASMRLLEKLGLRFERMIRMGEETAELRLYGWDASVGPRDAAAAG